MAQSKPKRVRNFDRRLWKRFWQIAKPYTQNEERIYAELSALESTLVSVTHHGGLAKYHGQMLHSSGDGGWTLTDVDEGLEHRSPERSGVRRSRKRVSPKAQGKAKPSRAR